MQEKKNNKGLILLIVILIVLVLGLIGYVVYDKISSKNNNQDENLINTTTTNIKNLDLSEEEMLNVSIEELKTNGFKKIDLTKIQYLETYELTDKLPNDLEGLKNSFELYDSENHIEETFLLNNKTLNYSFINNSINYSYEIIIENVKEIKYDYGTDNSYHRNIFVFTESGEIYYRLSDVYDVLNKDNTSDTEIEFKKIEGNYVDIIPLKRWAVADDYLLKNNKDEYVYLSTGLKYNTDTVYYDKYSNGDSMYILKNNDIYYNGQKTDIKFRASIEYLTDPIMDFYISQDNYLYSFQKPIEKHYNSKIKEIYTKSYYIVFVFEDDTRLVMQNSLGIN